jgi:glycerol-3-phosphate dehydrogenase (NAD(P)+)
MMANIVILGAGVMGSALTIPLSDQGHTVRLVGTHLDGDIIEEIDESRMHPRLRVAIPESVLATPIGNLEEALQQADLIILGVSSPGVRWAAETLRPLLPDGVPVLMVTKGLAVESGQIVILPEVFRRLARRADGKDLQMAALGGPSIARDLALRQDTCVQVAGADAHLVTRLAGMLGSPYYHLWSSTDLIGVEICVALKNAYALGVGLVQGMALQPGVSANGIPGHNPAAAVFAQSLTEMAYLVTMWGGRLESALGLPGAGDLYVTCQGGRNSRMGRWIGSGIPFREVMVAHMAGETVEGADLLLEIGPAVEERIAAGDLDGDRIPLLRALYRIVRYEAPPQLPWERFFAAA